MCVTLQHVPVIEDFLKDLKDSVQTVSTFLVMRIHFFLSTPYMSTCEYNSWVKCDAVRPWLDSSELSILHFRVFMDIYICR